MAFLTSKQIFEAERDFLENELNLTDDPEEIERIEHELDQLQYDYDNNVC